MGRLVVREAQKRPEDFTLVGAIGNPRSNSIGKGYQRRRRRAPVGAPIYAGLEEILPACDGVIDFSTVDRSMEVAAACVAYGKPLLVGTTGFSPRAGGHPRPGRGDHSPFRLPQHFQGGEPALSASGPAGGCCCTLPAEGGYSGCYQSLLEGGSASNRACVLPRVISQADLYA